MIQRKSDNILLLSSVSDILIDLDFIKRRINELKETLRYIERILEEDEENS